jgi:DNA-binding XRE family transcriptional regulator
VTRGVLLLCDSVCKLGNVTVSSSETSDPTNLAIARAVNQLREARDLTVDQLAVYAGLNRASLYRKLKGDYGWKATDVAALAKFFAVEPNDLFSGKPVLGPRRLTSRMSVTKATDTRQKASRDTRR